LAAAGRAIAIDDNLAEAHAARARVLTRDARFGEARREIDIALRLDPESYEVNSSAAGLCYAERRFGDAIPYYDKAATVMENDYNNSGMIISCYKAVGDGEGATRAARRALDLLDPLFDRRRADVMHWVKTDPDLDPVRDHPRFKALLSAAETRLAPASG